jgi:hypothetical protein
MGYKLKQMRQCTGLDERPAGSYRGGNISLRAFVWVLLYEYTS